MADLIARGMAGKALKEIDELQPSSGTVSAGAGISVSTHSGVSTIAVKTASDGGITTNSAGELVATGGSGSAMTLSAGEGISISTDANTSTVSIDTTVVATVSDLPQADGATITVSDGVWSAVMTESDPIFTASPAYSITSSDIADWNAKIDTESDPVFSASPAATITASDISNWNAIEGVPTFSVADDGKALVVTSSGTALGWDSISGGSGTTVVVPSSAPNSLSSYTSDDIQAISNCINNGDNSCIISYKDAYNRGYIYKLIYRTNTNAIWWCPSGNMTLKMGIDNNTHLVNSISYANAGEQGMTADSIKLETPIDTYYGNNVENSLQWLKNNKQDILTASTGITISGSNISVTDPLPTASTASAGDVLTVSDGSIVWAAPAVPASPSEIEYESTHSSGEDYMLTKVNGEDGVEVREKLYDNGDYNNGNYSYMNAGELGASDDDGASYIAISPMGISINTLDNNDDPVNGELSMNEDGGLQWNGDEIAMKNDMPEGSFPTSSDMLNNFGKVLAVNDGYDGYDLVSMPRADGTTITVSNGVWSAVGGGSSYTAGNGIEIDTNDVISSYSKDTTAGLLLALLGQSTAASSPFKANILSLFNTNTKDDFISAIKEGKVVEESGNHNWSGLGTDLNNLGYTRVITIADNGTYTQVNLTASNQANWKPTRDWCYWACNKIIIGVNGNYPNAFGLGITNNLYYNNATSGLSASTIKGAIDELAAKNVAVPTTTDGTYFLTATVSSGTATQSWMAVATASGTIF